VAPHCYAPAAQSLCSWVFHRQEHILGPCPFPRKHTTKGGGGPVPCLAHDIVLPCKPQRMSCTDHAWNTTGAGQRTMLWCWGAAVQLDHPRAVHGGHTAVNMQPLGQPQAVTRQCPHLDRVWVGIPRPHTLNCAAVCCSNAAVAPHLHMPGADRGCQQSVWTVKDTASIPARARPLPSEAAAPPVQLQAPVARG
jgi:hypothetical protein